MCLALVGDERILLSVAAEVDPFAELLHRGEVLDPVRVDRPQHHPALDRAHDLWIAELGLLGGVRVVDDLRHGVAQLFEAGWLAERAFREVMTHERAERGRQLV